MTAEVGAWKCEASIECIGSQGSAPTRLVEILSMRLDRLPDLSHLVRRADLCARAHEDALANRAGTFCPRSGGFVLREVFGGFFDGLIP